MKCYSYSAHDGKPGHSCGDAEIPAGGGQRADQQAVAGRARETRAWLPAQSAGGAEKPAGGDTKREGRLGKEEGEGAARSGHGVGPAGRDEERARETGGKLNRGSTLYAGIQNGFLEKVVCIILKSILLEENRLKPKSDPTYVGSDFGSSLFTIHL